MEIGRNRRLQKVLFTAFFVFSLLGCGGTGDTQSGSGSTGSSSYLAVSLKYPTISTNAWDKATFKPDIQGLQGNAFQCTLAYPAQGISINPNSCDLTFDGAQSGSTSLKVYLTVSGYLPVLYDVYYSNSGPGIYYGSLDSPSGVNSVLWQSPMSLSQGTPTFSNYSPSTGDSVSFSALGAIPNGLIFDPNTGLISGTPMTYGNSGLKIQATFTRNGRSLPVVLSNEIRIADPRANYPALTTASAGQTTKFAIPTFSNSLATDQYSFSYRTSGFMGCPVTPQRPAGTSDDAVLDRTTGAVRPVATAPGDYCMVVDYNVNRSGLKSYSGSMVLFKIQ